MIVRFSRLAGLAALPAALMAAVLFARPAAAQFSAREGFAPDGSYRWSFEVTPYLFLPAVDGRVGLNRPPGFDVSINQPRVTVAKLVSVLNGAFVGYGLTRYGNYSAEVNVDYISASQRRTVAPLLRGGSGATLNTSVSAVYVSPGFGYQVLPTNEFSKIALDARAGFSYTSISASAAFDRSTFGGTNVNYSFVQPWIGARFSYFPSPKWRVVLDTALTGLGVDNGAIGWNARLGGSYLVTKWFDISLGYAATQIRRFGGHGSNGENRNVSLLAYGPVLAMGFRF
jgi:hypothetical protein